MYKNKINVANKTNSSELVSPYMASFPFSVRSYQRLSAVMRSANGRQPLD